MSKKIGYRSVAVLELHRSRSPDLPRIIQRQPGHTSLATTDRYLSRIAPLQVIEAARLASRRTEQPLRHIERVDPPKAGEQCEVCIGRNELGPSLNRQRCVVRVRDKIARRIGVEAQP